GQSLHRLADDPQRLTEFLEPNQIAIVGITGFAERYVELHLVVGGVRFVLAHVAVDAGPAKRRTAQSEINRFISGEDADALGALQPDAIVGQERLVLDELLLHDVAELEDLLVPSRRNVLRQPTNAHRVVGESRAAEFLEQIQNQLALAE